MTFIQDQTQMPISVVDSQLQPLVPREDFLIISRVLLGFGIVASGFGIFTNVVNVITFISMGVKDGVTTLFLGLSISDLTFSVLTFICYIFILLYNMEERQTIWLTIAPTAMAYFSDNAAFIMHIMTALISTFLAVARCMCVVRPLHFKNMFTKTKSIIGLALCFLFPLACQAAVFAEMGMTKRFHASKNTSRLELWLSSDRERVKDIVRLILSFIVPFSTQIIVVVCVTVMIVKLRESANFRNRHVQDDVDKEPDANKLAGKDRQVAVQVILICTIYVITNIPKNCRSIYSLVEPQFDAGKAYSNLYNIAASIKIIFESINASANFFVYYKFSTAFRSTCFLTKAKSS